MTAYLSYYLLTLCICVFLSCLVLFFDLFLANWRELLPSCLIGFFPALFFKHCSVVLPVYKEGAIPWTNETPQNK